MEPKRTDLTWFVRHMTEAGMIPLSDYQKLRISFDGIPLDRNKRKRWWEEAQLWQDLLLGESGTSRG